MVDLDDLKAGLDRESVRRDEDGRRKTEGEPEPRHPAFLYQAS